MRTSWRKYNNLLLESTTWHIVLVLSGIIEPKATVLSLTVLWANKWLLCSTMNWMLLGGSRLFLFLEMGSYHSELLKTNVSLCESEMEGFTLRHMIQRVWTLQKKKKKKKKLRFRPRDAILPSAIPFCPLVNVPSSVTLPFSLFLRNYSLCIVSTHRIFSIFFFSPNCVTEWKKNKAAPAFLQITWFRK